MATARDADFLGGGGTLGPSGALAPKARATTPDGLYYLDTGEPTPIAIRRIQAGQPLRPKLSDAERKKAVAAEAQGLFDPKKANAAAVAAGGKAADYKFDSKTGTYYTEAKNGRRTYITNDPLRAQQAAETPIFTANDTGSGKQGYSNVLRNAAALGAAGSAAGGYGAAGGVLAGAFSGLPQAQGRGIALTKGSGAVPGRQGTAAEAAQANANYAQTGSSLPPGGGTNYFPLGNNPGGGGSNVAAYTPQYGGRTGGANTAISSEAQRIIGQAQTFANQSQTRANDAYSQASTAGSRAAPQMAMPSSANQQAVYDRAMGFQAQSGADRILAERADTSGAGRLENMQMDMQGVNNLESFRNTNSQQGVNALNAYNPDNTRQGVRNLDGYSATNTLGSANRLDNFYSHDAQQGADKLEQFRTSDAATIQQQQLAGFQGDRSGIDRLNNYADEAQGPSAAQAMLRSQSDADKRTALAIARSGRGGPGAIAAAQRQAISEGAAIAGETRGQGAALAAQETEAYKGRQLQALAQAGSLISQSEAQRLSAMQASGQMLTEQDSQRLAAVQAFAQVKTTMDAQRLSAQQAAGQLNASADTNRLGALQTSGQLRSNMDSQLLSATSNAAALQGDMDQRTLGAIGQAAGLRTQQDSIRSNNLQSAGQIRLSGSEINQRGAIAASSADLQAQALNLQSLSLAGQVSSDIRNQDINVLRSNLDASLQTMGLNDNQVRFFSQLGADREVASQNLQMQAGQFGVNARQAQDALNLQWEQFGLSQLSQQQQVQYQQQVLAQGGSQFSQSLAQQQGVINNQQQQQQRQNTLNTLGSAFTAFSTLFPTSQPGNAARSIAPVAGLGQSNSQSSNYSGYGQLPQQPNASGGSSSGQNSMGMVFDPFTNQWVYPSGARA